MIRRFWNRWLTVLSCLIAGPPGREYPVSVR